MTSHDYIYITWLYTCLIIYHFGMSVLYGYSNQKSDTSQSFPQDYSYENGDTFQPLIAIKKVTRFRNLMMIRFTIVYPNKTTTTPGDM